MAKKKVNHREHFLDKTEKAKIDRYVEICAQFYNLHINSIADKVLDVGASDGQLINHIKCDSYYAIDIKPAAKFVQKGTIMGIAESTFNVVVYNHVFEHLINPSLELQQIHKVLKYQGKLILNVPYFTAPWAWELEGHYHMYNEKNLSRLLELHGFTTIEFFRVIFRENKEELILIAQKC